MTLQKIKTLEEAFCEYLYLFFNSNTIEGIEITEDLYRRTPSKDFYITVLTMGLFHPLVQTLIKERTIRREWHTDREQVIIKFNEKGFAIIGAVILDEDYTRFVKTAVKFLNEFLGNTAILVQGEEGEYKQIN